MSRGLWTLILSISLIAAGCLGGDEQGSVACPDPELQVFHGTDGSGTVPTAPGEPIPLVYWATNPTDSTVQLVGTTLPAPEGALDPQDPGAPVDREIVHEVGPNQTSFAVFQPGPDGENLTLQVDLAPTGPDALVDGLDCDLTGVAAGEVPLAPPAEEDRGQTGKGVHVHTVGWWTNGSSFYTNLDRYHDSSLPKGYLGEYAGGDPLKVYVYDEDPDEMPRRYEEAGYAVTIPGFNEALKGIHTTAPRLVYLEPEQAYTREDRRDHALYGDALIFYIEAVEVEEVPCTVPEPVCDVPTTPDPPPPAASPALPS